MRLLNIFIDKNNFLIFDKSERSVTLINISDYNALSARAFGCIWVVNKIKDCQI